MARAFPVLVMLLVVLAGCSALPGDGTPEPSEHSLSVTISNEHDVSYEVGVTAIPAQVEGLEVTYENGSTRRFEVSSFDALPPTALRNATAIVTTDSKELSREFTVSPAEGIGTTLEDVPANSTVVYFVRQAGRPGTSRGAGVVQCNADIENTELEIWIRSDGSLHSSVTCSDDPE